MSNPLRIYIVDDDPAVADSLDCLLSLLGNPVETFASAEAFLAQATKDTRGCLLADLRMPGMSGIELLQRVRDLGCRLRVIILTAHADIPIVARAMKLGAVDFLEKPCPPAQILEAVRSALTAAGQQNEVMRPLTEFENRLGQLTSSERAVMEGLVLGRTNPEIAAALDVGLRTVQARRASVFAKFGVSNRAELVELALSVGWNPKKGAS